MTKRDNHAPSIDPPIHVRVLDAFHEFYSQLALIDARINDLQKALQHSAPASVVLAAGELDCAWNVLDARMHLVQLVTSDEAGCELWTLSALEQATARMHALLRSGAVYLAQHGLEAAQLLSQLRRLQSRLEVQERLIAQARSPPETPTIEDDSEDDLERPDLQPEHSADVTICFEARRARRRGRCITPPPEIRRYSRRTGRQRRRTPS